MNVKKILVGTLAASAFAAGSIATTAYAEGKVSASATVSNMYLWRGTDLGDGAAAVSGNLAYSISGAYAGVWVSSGDTTYGQEYDLYTGYTTGITDDVSVDISVWNYNYSDAGLTKTTQPGGSIPMLGVRDDTTGELTEIVLSLSAYGANISILDNVAGGSGYIYYTLGYGAGDFSATFGSHSYKNDSANMSHLNISYAYNDNLSFTVSKVVDEEVEGSYDDDAMFQVSYSFPIKQGLLLMFQHPWANRQGG